VRPLLADKIKEKDFGKLRFPLFASPKLDGMRLLGYPQEGSVVTRNLKPFPNLYAQERLSHLGLYHCDGEIIVGEPNLPRLTYRTTQKALSTILGEPRFTVYLFDHFEHPNNPWQFRFGLLDGREWEDPEGNRVVILPHDLIRNTDELKEYEEKIVSLGYEGVMIRDPQAPYKFGRSSVREGILLKLVRLETDEARIIGFKERMHNANEGVRNAQGYLERSSHRENMVGRGDLGACICESPKWPGETFDVGSGFDDDERTEIWNDREAYLGKILTFEHRPYGWKDVPRFPIFKGWRTDKDLEDAS